MRSLRFEVVPRDEAIKAIVAVVDGQNSPVYVYGTNPTTLLYICDLLNKSAAESLRSDSKTCPELFLFEMGITTTHTP